MKKVVSYRQTLIELAKIYKIDNVLNKNLKLTTYEIELEILKNKVPIPSRRGYFSHKIINELWQPFYLNIKEKVLIDFTLTRNLKRKYNNIVNSLEEIISINFSLKKILKTIFSSIDNYFNFVISNISNFFKILTKAIIDSLNKLYYFKVQEKVINKYILRGVYGSLIVMLLSGGFYLKDLVTNVDGLKISVEIKSDKKEKKIAKTPDVTKKNKSENIVKKPEVPKKPYDPEKDYTLNTQTVLNLFDDLEYDLDNVRNKKLVKPIYFTRLPKDLNEMRSVTKKKETFLQILLPLVVAENESIVKDRKYLLEILKQNQSEKNKKWINKKYKKYRVSQKNIDELIEKMDIIPVSIALAQAAKESGWGTSRFALEGNAIFGQWTWNGVGIEPLEKVEGTKHKILKFPLLRASVKAYITNLNTHAGYKSFRQKRQELRNQNKGLSGLDLIHELDNYAQTGKEYTKILEKIINQNDLDEFENVMIDDFKKNKQLKL